MNIKNLIANWPTTLIGLLSAVFAVIQGAQQPSIQAAFTNPTVQMAIIGAVLGFLAKYQGTTGTAANPRAVYQGDPVPVSPVVPPPDRPIPAVVEAVAPAPVAAVPIAVPVQKTAEKPALPPGAPGA